MRHRRSSIVLLTAAVVACGDSTGPKSEITLAFCQGTAWAGIQEEGEEWRSIADGPGTVTVEASERVIVARIFGSGGDPSLEFYYLTKDQAQAFFVCPEAGTKELTGSVTGMSVGLTQISLGTSVVFVAQPTNFTLRFVVDGLLDLVAENANRAIIRRGVSYPNGALIPVLDFASSESFALQANALTIVPNGVIGSRWTTELITARGTRGLLARGSPPDASIYTLPASRRESGDLYRLLVTGGDLSDFRQVEQFYATPSDQTVAFGPVVNRPTFTTLTTAGQQWRAEITAQPEYASQIQLVVARPQPSADRSTIMIRASKEYFGGTPAVWTLTLPDLSGVAGFPGWAPLPTPVVLQVFASDASWLFSSGTARAGDVIRSALRN